MIKTIFTFCLLGLNRGLPTSSGMSAPSANPCTPTFTKSCFQGGGTPPQVPRGPAHTGGWRGFQELPATLHSQTAPSSAVSVARGRFQKRGQCTSSAHTLPTETIRAQAMAAKFLRLIWWTEEENSQRPPTEMPHVRERLFSFPFAVNEFYSWLRLGAGSNPHGS